MTSAVTVCFFCFVFFQVHTHVDFNHITGQTYYHIYSVVFTWVIFQHNRIQESLSWRGWAYWRKQRKTIKHHRQTIEWQHNENSFNQCVKTIRCKKATTMLQSVRWSKDTAMKNNIHWEAMFDVQLKLSYQKIISCYTIVTLWKHGSHTINKGNNEWSVLIQGYHNSSKIFSHSLRINTPDWLHHYPYQ